MYKRWKYAALPVVMVTVMVGCKVPAATEREPNRVVPGSYGGSAPAAGGLVADSSNTATLPWQQFFADPYLRQLIDTALVRNQELGIALQEIEIARNEVRMRKGAILPNVALRAGAGLEKVGRYTSQGAGDATTEIKPGKDMPDPLGDFTISAVANWEVDIWKKLHNAKKAAVSRYLSTVEGRNFVITNLVAEIAQSYYELSALDNQLAIVKQYIVLQKQARDIVQVQKEAARATELAVQKFEAEVLKSESMEFEIRQQITETENRINLLLGRYPQPIARDSSGFQQLLPALVQSGVPAQLLGNRPDIRQAELELAAAKLDVKVARAEFYPSLDISAAIGLDAFNPSYLVKFPESILYSLVGDLAAPLINRNAIKAEFSSANARQLQALYNYERSLINAYLEVSTQLSNIGNLGQRYEKKSKQVEALTRSIGIANDLFKSARADYLEVLMTQRDALEARLELVETKQQQLNAAVQVYRDLGGGWR